MSKNSVKLNIKELPTMERPYEKLDYFGPQSLSDAELLAIIIKAGNKQETSVELCKRLISMCPDKQNIWAYMNNLTIQELMQVNGIGKVKAIQIKAALELSRRISQSRIDKNTSIRCPLDAANYMMESMRYLKKEYFNVLLLDIKSRVLKNVNISKGSLNSSLVHPREVFNAAIKNSAATLILMHNHPSGDPSPSIEDINITKRLIECGKLVGIAVSDHIIIGDGVYKSLREEQVVSF